MSEHIGTVQQRLANHMVTLVAIKEMPPHIEFGRRWIYQFDDAAGNRLVWFTGVRPIPQEDVPGRQLALSGTVRRHGEFGGVPQTELSRCQLRYAPVAV